MPAGPETRRQGSRRRRRAHNRAAGRPESDRFLHAALRARLLERLDWVQLEPRRIVDLGSGQGAALAALQERFPSATVLGLDHAPAMLRAAPPRFPRVVGAVEALPLADRSADLVFANLTLAYCPDLPACLAEIRRVLRAPGLFSFVTLGRDALRELSAAWAAADRFAHVPPQPDMHDLGDLLIQAGFGEPVLDTDTLQVTYRNVADLIRDLRAAGAVNSLSKRNPALTGRSAMQRFRAALLANQDAEGRFSISIEVVFGKAWAGTGRPARASGEVEVPLDLLGGLKNRPGGEF